MQQENYKPTVVSNKGCEWIDFNPIPEDTLMYAIQTKTPENRKFIKTTQSINEGWIKYCKPVTIPSSEPQTP